MLFSDNKVKDAYRYFIELIDENIDLFGAVIEKKLEAMEGERLSDEEFVSCYVEGMHKLVQKIHESAGSDLKSEPRCYARYLDAMQYPGRCGFRFQNEDVTIGKIYLYYIWGKTRKRAPKGDCIRLEKYAVQLIGKQCLKYGIVQ